MAVTIDTLLAHLEPFDLLSRDDATQRIVHIDEHFRHAVTTGRPLRSSEITRDLDLVVRRASDLRDAMNNLDPRIVVTLGTQDGRRDLGDLRTRAGIDSLWKRLSAPWEQDPWVGRLSALIDLCSYTKETLVPDAGGPTAGLGYSKFWLAQECALLFGMAGQPLISGTASGPLHSFAEDMLEFCGEPPVEPRDRMHKAIKQAVKRLPRKFIQEQANELRSGKSGGHPDDAFRNQLLDFHTAIERSRLFPSAVIPETPTESDLGK